jgi:hypothetical protein
MEVGAGFGLGCGFGAGEAGDQVVGQVDGEAVEDGGRRSGRGRADTERLDKKCGGAGGDAEEAEVGVVELIEVDGVALAVGFGLLAGGGFFAGCVCLHCGQVVIAAVACDDIGNLTAIGFHDAGVALVQMGVTAENEIGPDAGGGAAGIDLREHGGAGKVLAASGEGRMMHGEDEGLRILVLRIGFARGESGC